MCVIQMTQEQQEIQLPFLPSAENIEALSSFMTGRTSRSNSVEDLEQPRLRSQEAISSFPRSFDDVEMHFEDNDEHQQKLKHQKCDADTACPVPPPAKDALGDGASDDPNSEILACLRCQKRKSKCDHGQPCSICLALGQDCTYSKPKKRGPKPGSMLRIKEEAHHLKQAFKVLLQTLINVHTDFEELGPSVCPLLNDTHVFDAASCQAVLKGLSDCLVKYRKVQQESRVESKTKAKGGVARQ